MTSLRADLYHALAEALAEPPAWMASSGKGWPLFQTALRLAQSSEAAYHAAMAFEKVRAGTLSDRLKRYNALFKGPGRPKTWLYESLHLSGKLAGPEMMAVEKLYRIAGLEIANAELPDHASLELAFLAFLAEKQDLEPKKRGTWRNLEKQFIKKHAGRWLPAVGQAMACSGDEVYAPMGHLLTNWLGEAMRVNKASPTARYPVIFKEESCTLCGFCAQVCPAGAITVRETQQETTLWLSTTTCTGCARCEQVCVPQALKMFENIRETIGSNRYQVLHRSPRVICPLCQSPTVSRAELDFVASQIGNPSWLAYCLSCRAQVLEVMQ